MLPENKASTLVPYASKADPEYVSPIPLEQQEKGVVPLDSLPAQYWNWLWNTLTTQHNLSVATVTSILTELQKVLTLAGITPDEADTSQLASAIKKLTLDIIGDLSDLTFASDDIDTVVAALNAVDKRISTIESKIPSAASSTNKLTDEAFVLRHVATNTANFRGEWPDWASVPEDGDQYPVDYSGNHDPTENDYMVVRDMADYDIVDLTDANKSDITTHANDIVTESETMQTALSQANLMAMNGAIEAAHMGDVGAALSAIMGDVHQMLETTSAMSLSVKNGANSIISGIDEGRSFIHGKASSILEASASLENILSQCTALNAQVLSEAQNLPEEPNPAGLILVCNEVANSLATATQSNSSITVDAKAISTTSNSPYKGAWQFKYTGSWESKGREGWEPEFSLGSLVDYDLLDQRYALNETVEGIEEKIPAAASATNPLTDQKWVKENAAPNWNGTAEEFEEAIQVTDPTDPKYIKDKSGLDIFSYEQESWFPISSKVQLGNLNAVTSDAVAKAFELDYSKVQAITLPWTATGRGMVLAHATDVGSDGSHNILVNGQIIFGIDGSSSISNMYGHVLVSKGDVVSAELSYTNTKFIPYKIQF